MVPQGWLTLESKPAREGKAEASVALLFICGFQKFGVGAF